MRNVASAVIGIGGLMGIRRFMKRMIMLVVIIIMVVILKVVGIYIIIMIFLASLLVMRSMIVIAIRSLVGVSYASVRTIVPNFEHFLSIVE